MTDIGRPHDRNSPVVESRGACRRCSCSSWAGNKHDTTDGRPQSPTFTLSATSQISSKVAFVNTFVSAPSLSLSGSSAVNNSRLKRGLDGKSCSASSSSRLPISGSAAIKGEHATSLELAASKIPRHQAADPPNELGGVALEELRWFTVGATGGAAAAAILSIPHI